jgi:hypothetical protein
MKVKTNVKAGSHNGNGNGNGSSSSQIAVVGIGTVGINNGTSVGIFLA